MQKKSTDRKLKAALEEQGVKGEFPLILDYATGTRLTKGKEEKHILMKNSKSKLKKNIPFYKPISRIIIPS
ncbi:MAG: hypothetical protein AAFN81_08010 [Bacteroidota bacterium]